MKTGAKSTGVFERLLWDNEEGAEKKESGSERSNAGGSVPALVYSLLTDKT